MKLEEAFYTGHRFKRRVYSTWYPPNDRSRSYIFSSITSDDLFANDWEVLPLRRELSFTDIVDAYKSVCVEDIKTPYSENNRFTDTLHRMGKKLGLI